MLKLDDLAAIEQRSAEIAERIRASSFGYESADPAGLAAGLLETQEDLIAEIRRLHEQGHRLALMVVGRELDLAGDAPTLGGS